jgi:flagellar hook assembly protein FlgD
MEALTVFVPEVATEVELFRNVVVDPGVVTPDGDGVNDHVQVSFDVVKGVYPVEITIATLGGRVVTVLTHRAEGRAQYRWDGRDRSGVLVPPGIYLCRIWVKAEVGAQSLDRIIYVVY